MKMRALIVALSVALLVLPAVVNAATLDIVGPNQVDIALGTFTFDVFLSDAAGLPDLNYLQFGLDLIPITGSGASFVAGAIGTTARSDYVFSGNSFAFDAVLDGTGIVPNDAANSGTQADYVDKLLAMITVDITGASVGDTYSVDIYSPLIGTFFGDASGGVDAVAALAAPYEFQVVPIPAAAWLLGAGLLGLVGLRRKSS